MDLSALWINGGDSHSNARRLVNRLRTLARIPRAALLAAAAAYLAACSSSASRNVAPGDGLSVGAPAAPPPEAGSEGVQVNQETPPPSPPSTSSTANANRDRQLDILNEAVAALRQEASRSYQRTNDLARDTERLRGLIASLQKRIAKSRVQNRELLDHVHGLERKLQEIGTPAPPEGLESAKPIEPPPVAEAPASPAPIPQEPLPQEPPPAPGGTDGSANPPGDEAGPPLQ